MSTQPAAKPVETPFKTQDELQAFLKRTVVEEVGPAVTEALKPLTEKTHNVMREMLERHDSEVERGKAAAMPKGHMFARIVRANALAFLETRKSGDPEAVKFAVSKRWGSDDPVVKAIDDMAKLKATASQAGDPNSLGNLIAPQWSREFIGLLRNKAVVRSIARVIPNPTGSLTLRRQTTGGTAYWIGEGKPITPSKPGVGLMNFLRKKLGVLSVVSNDLIRYAGPEADAFVTEDMIAVSALAEDLSFLRGDGTQYAPKGIRNLVNTAQVFAQTGTTLAAIDADYAKALRLIEEANISIDTDSIHWLMVPRTYWALFNAAPATDAGARPYRDGLENRDAVAPMGRILGYPVHKTNQIPKNLGGGTNESETYCVNGPALWIADTLNVQLDVFDGGAYEDAGVVVSGISRDETPIRLIRETDFNMQYQEAAAVHTGVTLA